MNQDTIPSQLDPATVPSALGAMGASSREPQSTDSGPALVKWVLAGAALAALWFISR